MPWRTWSSAVCRISRLYWIAAWRRRAASRPPWSRPCVCATAATAPVATMPRRWPRPGYVRHGAQPEISLVLGLERDAVRAGKTFEGAVRAIFAEITGDRGGELFHRHRGAPETGSWGRYGPDRTARIDWLANVRSARARAATRSRLADEINRQAPDHAMHQRRISSPNKCCGRNAAMCQGPSVRMYWLMMPTSAKLGSSSVRPTPRTPRSSGERAAGGGAAPEQAAEKRRRQLRERREGEQTDGGSCASPAVR